MSSRAEEAPMLVAQSGPLNGQRWPLRQVFVLGREPDCDIVIPDRQVSRHHARISITDQEVQLEDLESKNGTFLNGKTVNSIVPLQNFGLELFGQFQWRKFARIVCKIAEKR